jgi:hypothetical protein
MKQCSVADTKTVWSLEYYVVLFLSLIFCKQEEKLLFFGSVEDVNNNIHPPPPQRVLFKIRAINSL